MFRGLEDNPLEIFRLDVTVTILVEDVEGLPNALALQSSEHLSELGVCHVVPGLAPSGVQGSPFRIPIERYTVTALIHIVYVLERLPLDRARSIEIEESESNLIFGIGLGQEVLESRPVTEGESTGPSLVGDSEEESIVFALDFVLSIAKKRKVVSHILETSRGGPPR